MTWYEALVTTLVGALGGGVGTWYAVKERLENKIRKEYEEKKANAARRRAMDSGRHHPRRPDAAQGASRISQIRMGRNVKPPSGKKPAR